MQRVFRMHQQVLIPLGRLDRDVQEATLHAAVHHAVELFI